MCGEKWSLTHSGPDALEEWGNIKEKAAASTLGMKGGLGESWRQSPDSFSLGAQTCGSRRKEPGLAREAGEGQGHFPTPTLFPAGPQRLFSVCPLGGSSIAGGFRGDAAQLQRGKCVMGLWGHFLPYWEMLAKVGRGCRKSPEMDLESGSAVLREGFWLRCTAWVFSGPAWDSCRPATAISGLRLES